MFSITFLGAERKRSVSYSQDGFQLQITPSPLLQPSQALESEGWLTQWSLDSAHRGQVKLPLKQEDHHHGAASVLIRHLFKKARYLYLKKNGFIKQNYLKRNHETGETFVLNGHVVRVRCLVTDDIQG